MEGRTLFSSAGDTGSSCPLVPAATLNGVTNEAAPVDNYPASSPNAVDVGGTVLYTNPTKPVTRAQEYTWTYSGGGTSVDLRQAELPGRHHPDPRDLQLQPRRHDDQRRQAVSWRAGRRCAVG